MTTGNDRLVRSLSHYSSELASVIVLVVSALVSDTVLPGLLIAAGIVVLSWAIVRMTVSIAIAEVKIVLRCAPCCSTEVSI